MALIKKLTTLIFLISSNVAYTQDLSLVETLDYLKDKIQFLNWDGEREYYNYEANNAKGWHEEKYRYELEIIGDCKVRIHYKKYQTYNRELRGRSEGLHTHKVYEFDLKDVVVKIRDDNGLLIGHKKYIVDEEHRGVPEVITVHTRQSSWNKYPDEIDKYLRFNLSGNDGINTKELSRFIKAFNHAKSLCPKDPFD